MSIMAYAWSDNQGATPHIEPIVWAGQTVTYQGPDYSLRDIRLGDPYAAGIDAAAALLAKAPGRRCLGLFGFGSAGGVAANMTARDVKGFFHYGCLLDDWTVRMDTFMQGFRDGGAPVVDMIYTDFETIVFNVFAYPDRNTWANDVVLVRSDPLTAGALSPELRSAPQSTLASLWGSDNPNAFLVEHWNTRTRRIVAVGLRATLFRIAREYLSYIPVVVNDGDVRLRRNCPDFNGWAGPSSEVRLKNCSSPELYNYKSDGTQYRWRDYQGGRWPALIDNLNTARALIGVSRPTISSFTWQGDSAPATDRPEAFQELVKHLGVLGGGEAQHRVIFWNVHETTPTQRSVHEAAFASAPAAVANASRDEIPLGTAQITTGGVTTLYDPALFGPGGVH